MLHFEENQQERDDNREEAASEETVNEEGADEVDWQEKYQRLAADFANYRRRVNAERDSTWQAASENLLRSVLKIYDDFVRLQNVSSSEGDLDEGVRSIQKRWENWLAEHKVEMMSAAGEPFDHNLHEALLQQPVSVPELDGRVIEVIENGYLCDGRVLRHAKVVVGRHEDSAAELAN